MSIRTPIEGLTETVETVLSNTSVTALVDADEFETAPVIHSIAYASAAGDTLTLDTFDGTTARRLRQVAIAANADGVFSTEFMLPLPKTLRGTLTTGNATAIRITLTGNRRN